MGEWRCHSCYLRQRFSACPRNPACTRPKSSLQAWHTNNCTISAPPLYISSISMVKMFESAGKNKKMLNYQPKVATILDFKASFRPVNCKWYSPILYQRETIKWINQSHLHQLIWQPRYSVGKLPHHLMWQPRTVLPETYEKVTLTDREANLWIVMLTVLECGSTWTPAIA